MIRWPDGKAFAFTVFDDPDVQSIDRGKPVYDFLRDQGFRTTKGVWPTWGPEPRPDLGGSGDDPAYLEWCLELQRDGFEIGYHNAQPITATREQTREGLARFERLFGHPARTMSNHYLSEEGIYWGEHRLSGVRRSIYNLLTRGQGRGRSGHVVGHPHFWGDLCREHVTYVRNFVYREINTLKACPWMPYYDPERPYVNAWYASTEGNNVDAFVDSLGDAAVDRLAAEGGACIMYTHFAYGYVDRATGALHPRFRQIMERMSRMNGWFVPVGTLLDHLAAAKGTHTLTDGERSSLEWRWLRGKVLHGTA